jgi:hypothetical protein
MADDLDKFVLEYTVNLKDSVARLEKLSEKMKGVQKTSKEGANDLKKFAADASSELGKLVPGMDAVSRAVRAMGAEFAVAGAALGALAIGVKAVMALRQQYNMQRSEGMQLGVSPTRIEEYTRKFAKGSNGYVSRDMALEGLKTFSGMANSAYTDPTRLGREARIMRMLGVNVGERGQTPTSLNTELTQLALGLQGKSKSDVQGIAKATGMSQDWLLTVQKLGPAIGKVTETTQEEIQKRQSAEANMDKFNDQLGQLKEKFVEISNVLAQPLLPALTRLVTLMEKLAAAIPKAAKDTDNAVGGTVGAITGSEQGGKKFSGGFGLLDLFNGNYFSGKSGGNKWGVGGALWDMIMGPSNNIKSQQDADNAQKNDKAAAEKRDDAVDKMDEANKMGLQTANEMALAVNMFSGAVQSFSSAINIQQAWAAWAGEIGKAAGLPGSSGTNVVSNVGPTKYDDIFARAAKKYPNVSVDLLKRVATVESHMDPSQTSPTGAAGIMQITRGNWKKLGNGQDVRDPEANIMVGAGILSDFIKRNPGDLPAALRGYNGNSDPNYVNKVLGQGSGIGESRSKMNVRAVQQSIADYLHVPLEQIQRGGVTTGDAGWASSQLQAGIQNNIFDLKRQLSVGGMPAQNYAKLQQELRDQSRGLDMLRQYGDQVVGRQQPGDQQRTVGERPIIINVNGATDPKAVAAEVNNQLTKSMNDLINHYSTGIKG